MSMTTGTIQAIRNRNERGREAPQVLVRPSDQSVPIWVDCASDYTPELGATVRLDTSARFAYGPPADIPEGAVMTLIGPVSPLALDIRLLFAQLTTMQRDWQDAIGFGEEGIRLRSDVRVAEGNLEPADPRRLAAEANLRNYYLAKLALIDTEVAEAIEEIRQNRAIDERYYSTAVSAVEAQTALRDGEVLQIDRLRAAGIPVKPEGVPSELADIVIRCLSLAGEIGIDLGDVLIEKLNYNATRAQRHGGKAI